MPTRNLDAMKRFESEGGTWIATEQCIHISSPHLLSQISGHAKHVLGAEGTTVFYRGQSQLYPKMLPGLYRKTSRSVEGINVTKRNKTLAGYIKYIKETESFLRGVSNNVYEPLLQHYGIRTRWLDVVDNIWIALWFACYNALTSGNRDQFLHFERRSAIGSSNFAYIVILAIDGAKPSTTPGFLGSKDYMICDLRVSAPSLYIRPHAQHGIVIKKKNVNDLDNADLTPLVTGVIRVGLNDALAWLGSGDLLTAHTLFPPPYYDHGYRRLLEIAPPAPEVLGSIVAVGP